MSSAVPHERPDEGPAAAARRMASEALEKARSHLKERKPINWALVWARTKYVAWTLATKSIITVIYLEIVSQGIVYLFPDMGKRLWKIPMFSFFNDYEATHRINLAHVFAVVPLFATWVLWSLLLSMYLKPERFAETFKKYDVEKAKRVILIIGAIVIVSDAGLFGASFSMSSWGSSRFSATAVLATALYCAVIAFVSLISMFLADEVRDLKEKKEN